MRRALALVALASGACTSLGAGAGGMSGEAGQAGRYDRVLVRRFADIYAVALSARTVYVGTDRSIGSYDRLLRSWAPPLNLGGEFLDRVTTIAADPGTEGVWIGGTGSLWFYEPALDLVTRALVPGRVDRIAFDARDPTAGALVHSGGVWSRVSQNGVVLPLMTGDDLRGAQLVLPPTLDDLRREYPSLRAFETLLTRDSALRSWPVISGARSPDRISDIWLGTYGSGVFEVDPNFAESAQRPFGLLGSGGGALARAAGGEGVWIAPLGVPGPLGGSPPRNALSFASDDLRRWRWLDLDAWLFGGHASVSSSDMRQDVLSVHRMRIRGSEAWLATNRGVVRVSLGEGPARFVTNFDGLPGAAALDVALWRDALLVATPRGLCLLDTATLRRRGDLAGVPGTPAALLVTGDTAWIGTDAGLFLLAGSAPPRRLSARAVRALAAADSLILFGTEGELFRVDAAAREQPIFTAVNFRRVGGITAVAVDGRAVAAAGATGVVVASRAAPGLSRYDSAGEVHDLLLTDSYLWLATRDGLLRIRRQGNGELAP